MTHNVQMYCYKGGTIEKFSIEVENDLIKFFRDNIDDTEPIEVLLVHMLRLLREILLSTIK